MSTDHWGSHFDFILVLLGFGVGLGTLWKYPYLCVRNGGAAFLIPFILFSLIGTIPVVFLEMTIGQFSQSGPVNVWNLCPPFRDRCFEYISYSCLGLGTVVITSIFTTYYTVLMSWFIYYTYHSFSSKLPWVHCDNEWNTPTCIAQGYTASTVGNHTDVLGSNNSLMLLSNQNISEVTAKVNSTEAHVQVGLTAAEEFWRYNTLQLTDGLTEVGSVRWPIALCSASMYLCIFLCLFKGVKISGKVVYVTVVVPYILIVVFLIRACLLPGSLSGIYYYISPDFTKLKEPKVWIEACNYALYSLGVACGGIPTMAGHNKFSNNCTRDSIIFVLGDMLSTVFAGFSFFAVIGHVAHIRNVPISAFESSGFNLGFIVYPEVISTLPLPHLWSVLSFITFLTLGFDSLVPCYEAIIMALCDIFPSMANRRCILIALILLVSFLTGMLYITQGGMYILTLVEWYCFFPSLALFAMLECIVVGWIYGTERLTEDIEMMWGKKMPMALIFSLRYIEPLIMMVVFSYAIYSYRPPKYADYTYPVWATGIGWIISLSSITPAVVHFLWYVAKGKGQSMKEKLKNVLQPSHKWGPFDKNISVEITTKMLEEL